MISASSSIPRPAVGQGLATACLQEGVWLEVAAFFWLPWRPAHLLPTTYGLSLQPGWEKWEDGTGLTCWEASFSQGPFFSSFSSHGYFWNFFEDFQLWEFLAADLLILANATWFGELTCNFFFSPRNPAVLPLLLGSPFGQDPQWFNASPLLSPMAHMWFEDPYKNCRLLHAPSFATKAVGQSNWIS